MTRASITSLAALAAVMALGACHNAKSPETAAKDIAAADNSAARGVEKAQASAQKDMSADAYKIVMAQADGEHDVAIQKCETLQGNDQVICKQQADADYDAAKANAKAAKVDQQP